MPPDNIFFYTYFVEIGTGQADRDDLYCMNLNATYRDVTKLVALLSTLSTMTKIGYTLSSEEHSPKKLLQLAQKAEATGFDFISISDHYHPWIDAQGNSPFVWGMLGAISQVTSDILVGVGVTCPTTRIHPAIIAQAAATAATLLEGRFVFGVGTGENLNEHVLGDRWPPYDIRSAMLTEAVHIIRELWTGETISYWGEYYDVEDARIYTLPEQLPPIIVAGSGPQAIELAAEIGDGYWGLAPKRADIERFENAGGSGPKFGQLHICYAESEEQARQTVAEVWPNTGLMGELSAELRTPTHFEQAVKPLTTEHITKDISCGPDVDAHLEQIQKFIDAGYDHVYIHQIGPDQASFFDVWERELRPALK